MKQGSLGGFKATGTFSQLTMSSWLKSWENSFCSSADFNDTIRSYFCTCHNSWAVVTCAKIWPDCIIFPVRAILMFIIFRLWAHILFVEWVRGIWQTRGRCWRESIRDRVHPINILMVLFCFVLVILQFLALNHMSYCAYSTSKFP